MIEREKLGTNETLKSIFDELFNLISEANRLPLTEKIIIDEQDLSAIIDELRDAIPKEVQNAGKVLEDQKNIVENAQAEASAIVEKANTGAEHIITAAKEEAERILRQEDIVKQAEALSRDIKNNALRYADQVKRDADTYSDNMKNDSLKYADEMLSFLAQNLDTNLGSALKSLQDNHETIESERQKLAEVVNGRVQHVADDEEETGPAQPEMQGADPAAPEEE